MADRQEKNIFSYQTKGEKYDSNFFFNKFFA